MALGHLPGRALSPTGTAPTPCFLGCLVLWAAGLVAVCCPFGDSFEDRLLGNCCHMIGDLLCAPGSTPYPLAALTPLWMDPDRTVLSEMSDGKRQEPFDFTPMWGMKQKATHEQRNQTHRHRQQKWLSEGTGLRGDKEGKGGQIEVC